MARGRQIRFQAISGAWIFGAMTAAAVNANNAQKMRRPAALTKPTISATKSTAAYLGRDVPNEVRLAADGQHREIVCRPPENECDEESRVTKDDTHPL